MHKAVIHSPADVAHPVQGGSWAVGNRRFCRLLNAANVHYRASSSLMHLSSFARPVHTGHFWQDRYKSIIISKDEYLLACGSYVELNPVRAGMVKAPKDYPWSSYGVNAYGKKDDLIDKHIIFNKLSTDESVRKEYRSFVQQMQRQHESMRGEMDRRTIYGGSAFIQNVQKQYKLDAVIKKRGRPRKEKSNIENK